jgi:ATP-dependent protease ClpP protease subunit
LSSNFQYKIILIYLAIAICGCSSQNEVSDSKNVQLTIDKEITLSTLKEFREQLKLIENKNQKLHMNAVFLNSWGGNGEVAREIGEIIRAKRLNTYVAEDAICVSACSFILIGGVQRYAFGKVGVHRSTYFEDVDYDTNVARDIERTSKKISEYNKSMGVSMLFDDAINTTESWRIRYLTENEKKQWQVFGTDRLEEELLFNRIARERYISRVEFIRIFKSNYEECLIEAQKERQTIFECAKSREYKEPSYSIQFKKWFSKLLKENDDIEINRDNFQEQIKAIKKKIRDGEILKRYTKIIEIDNLHENSKKLNAVGVDSIEKLESKNTWWIEGNDLNVLIVNPTSSELKEIVFELSNSDCEAKEAVKKLLSLPLIKRLEKGSRAVYSGNIPFDYQEIIGKGTRCGLIVAAYI